MSPFCISLTTLSIFRTSLWLCYQCSHSVYVSASYACGCDKLSQSLHELAHLSLKHICYHDLASSTSFIVRPLFAITKGWICNCFKLRKFCVKFICLPYKFAGPSNCIRSRMIVKFLTSHQGSQKDSNTFKGVLKHFFSLLREFFPQVCACCSYCELHVCLHGSQEVWLTCCTWPFSPTLTSLALASLSSTPCSAIWFLLLSFLEDSVLQCIHKAALITITFTQNNSAPSELFAASPSPSVVQMGFYPFYILILFILIPLTPVIFFPFPF